uniref:E3 ubiquitin-protein ligase synoviolin n=1 Tax=Ornithorhynchus anatinus TaxID=9258 RepID=A0A6I8N6P7_ORNAN
MFRTAVMMAASLALTGAVVAHAYYLKHQFYPTVVYLTKSSPSMAVLYIQAFVLVFLLGKVMGKVFFGQLRAAEMEHLLERSWYAVTETCLAFTVFRDDFSPRFVALFTLLLFLKCFHWLAEDRVDFYAILMTMVLTVFIKYVLHSIDLQSENPWDNKAVYMLYTELFTGFIKVLLYMAFMTIMIKVHTFPLFAIRPMYLAMRQFKKAVTDAIMSRRAIRNMNTLYPDATPEELQATDNVCIICREEMVAGAKRLPCNHIFHTSCLRSWFQRQQTCPTCRMDVLRASLPAQSQPPPEPPEPGPQAPPHRPPVSLRLSAVPQGLLPPFPPGMFPLWPPMGPFPPAPPPSGAADAAAPSAAGEPDRGGGGRPLEGRGGGPGPPRGPRPSRPPAGPPPPPPPGFPPMPVPPAGFAGLTAEELRALEGHERQHLEARLQSLRNIHTLLDAAMLQINQYLTVLASLGPPRPPAPPGPTAATVASASSSVPSSEAATPSAGSEPPPSEPARTTPPPPASEGPGAEAATEDGEPDTEELRRRRLQKLGSPVSH